MTVKKLIPNFLYNFTYKIERITINENNFINAIENKFYFMKLNANDYDYLDSKNYFSSVEEIQYKSIIKLGFTIVFVRSTSWKELKNIQNEKM